MKSIKINGFELQSNISYIIFKTYLCNFTKSQKKLFSDRFEYKSISPNSPRNLPEIDRNMEFKNFYLKYGFNIIIY